MLDLNYVRRKPRSSPNSSSRPKFSNRAVDDFARIDAERRRIIAESDKLNAERNNASREIGAMMKDGRREEPMRDEVKWVS